MTNGPVNGHNPEMIETSSLEGAVGSNPSGKIEGPVSRANISAVSGQQAVFFFSEKMTDDDLLCFVFELSRNLRESNRKAMREANGITQSGILIPKRPALG